ncbi:MAG: DUF1015 domain-containing protein [Actinomycetes bacterium]
MPVASDNPAPGDAPAGAARRRLRVFPFRGVRYDPARVSDLAAVTSPPYDVIDSDSVAHLEELDPHNVVRLILPRAHLDDAHGGYDDAAARLHTWLGDGTLVRDDEPALYVYEQVAGELLQRGVFAAVELHDPADRVVLPHEDVMPGPVADRLELMRTTSANLEPILLVYEGGGDTATVIDEVTAGSAPLIETTTEDGLTQRVWRVSDAAQQARIAADLEPRQALIADGHHRYATYRRLQAEKRAAGEDTGPWDSGLALLVDSRTYPLRVQAIHRAVQGLSMTDALAAAAQVFTVEPLEGGLEEALRTLDTEQRAHPFVLTDGSAFALISNPDPVVLADALPPLQSDLWRSLDASVLHAVLLEELFALDPTDERVRYVHDAAGAVREAARSGGTAVLMRPVEVGQVLAVAAQGERMPRKSTSFGPKPRTGLVLRLLDGDSPAGL